MDDVKVLVDSSGHEQEELWFPNGCIQSMNKNTKIRKIAFLSSPCMN